MGCACPAGRAPQVSPPAPTHGQAYLAVGHGTDSDTIICVAIAALGGIEPFVRLGDDVIIRPNVCVDYHPPEHAGTTNPQVVATLYILCLATGAWRVRVMGTRLGARLSRPIR